MLTPTMIRKTDCHRKFSAGYTLLELAISILVIGIIIGSIGSVVVKYQKTVALNTTLNNESIIAEAINNYLQSHGHYPCPAPFVPRSDPRYGLVGDCTDTTSVAVGDCNNNNKYTQNNYCVQASDRVFSATPPLTNWTYSYWPPTSSTTPLAWTNRVRRGEVPFLTIGIPEFDTIDGYGDVFQYAVTESLASTSQNYNPNLGGIDVRDGSVNPSNPPSVINPPSTIQYVLISNGPDRKGAYTDESDLYHPVYPCPPVGTTFDSFNCQIYAQQQPQAIYYIANYSTAPGPAHFDDTLRFFASISTPLWAVTDDTDTNIVDTIGAGDAATAGKVTIDKAYLPTLPAPTAALQVGSNYPDSVAVNTSGTLNANQLCSTSGTGSCYKTNMDMKCPSGYSSGFSDGIMACTPTQQVTCPPNSYVTGISSSGHLVCTSSVPCTSRSVKLCWNNTTGQYDTFTLPQGSVGQSITTSPPDVTLTKTFECKNTSSGSQWVYISSTGSCTACTSSPPTQTTMTCNDYYGYPCSSCWSGNATVQTTQTCSGGVPQYSSTLLSSTCACQPSTWTNPSRACPAGYTGTYTTTESFTCDPSNPTAPAQGPFWTSTQKTDCVCNPSATKTQTITCQAAGYGAGYSGSVTQTAQMNCSTNSWGAWTTTSDTCTCSPIDQWQNIGCPNGQQGFQIQKQTYDCIANTWGPWNTVFSTCSTYSYAWGLNGGEAPSGTSSRPLAIQLGNACFNQGATNSCSQPNGTGGYYIYSTCVCE